MVLRRITGFLLFLKNFFWLCRNVHESRTQAMMNNHGFFMVNPENIFLNAPFGLGT